MSKSSSHGSESMERSRHVNTSNCHNISRTTFSCIDTFSNTFHCSWYMSNRNLFTRLLKFNFLETDEFRTLDLHDELTFGLICHTFLTWTFNFRIEFSCINDLIDFETTNITSIDCNLDTRSNI